MVESIMLNWTTVIQVDNESDVQETFIGTLCF